MSVVFEVDVVAEPVEKLAERSVRLCFCTTNLNMLVNYVALFTFVPDIPHDSW